MLGSRYSAPAVVSYVNVVGADDWEEDVTELVLLLLVAEEVWLEDDVAEVELEEDELDVAEEVLTDEVLLGEDVVEEIEVVD